MHTLSGVILQVVSNSWVCATERVSSEFCRCSENNKDCKYGLSAGKACTYCLNPDRKEFLILYI